LCFDYVEGSAQIEFESAVEPRLEDERARLVVEWKQRYVDGTRRRKPSRRVPAAGSVRQHLDVRRDALVKLYVRVLEIAAMQSTQVQGRVQTRLNPLRKN